MECYNSFLKFHLVLKQEIWDAKTENYQEIFNELTLKYKYQFSKHLIGRMKKRNIDERWVVEAIKNYDYKVEISEVEVHYFKKIEERDKKCLKVVLNPIAKTIVTAYFDRGVTKRGYKYENNI